MGLYNMQLNRSLPEFGITTICASHQVLAVLNKILKEEKDPNSGCASCALKNMQKSRGKTIQGLGSYHFQVISIIYIISSGLISSSDLFQVALH